MCCWFVWKIFRLVSSPHTRPFLGSTNHSSHSKHADRNKHVYSSLTKLSSATTTAYKISHEWMKVIFYCSQNTELNWKNARQYIIQFINISVPLWFQVLSIYLFKMSAWFCLNFPNFSAHIFPEYFFRSNDYYCYHDLLNQLTSL